MIDVAKFKPKTVYVTGGTTGWPTVLSSLKSVLETGKPVVMVMEGPPPSMLEAVKKAIVEKPWLKS